MANRIVSLDFPLRGLNKALSHRAQPPQTSPDLLNVRWFEAIEGRARGGQRPGLTRTYPQRLGSGNPIRLITQGTRLITESTSTQTQYFFYWKDVFDRTGDSLGPDYTDATWLGTSPPTTDGGSYTNFGNPRGAWSEQYRLGMDGAAPSQPLTVLIEITPNAGQHWGIYYLFVAYDSVNPDPRVNGIIARFRPRNGSVAAELRLIEYQASVAINTWSAPVTPAVPATPITFSLTFTGQETPPGWRVKVQGYESFIQADLTVRPEGKIGFGMDVSGSSGLPAGNLYPPAICLVSRFEVSALTTEVSTATSARTFLFASAFGRSYVEHTPGVLDRITGPDAGLSADRLLCADWRSDKIYIADWGLKVQGDDDHRGTLASNGYDLTAVGISTWVAYHIDPASDVIMLYDTTGAVEEGTYGIADVQGGKLVLNSSAGGAGTGKYRVERAPKVYNAKTDSLTIWGSMPPPEGSSSSSASSGSSSSWEPLGKGVVPSGCSLVCLWADRMVLASSDTDPHIWFMSRQGDPYDWDYGQDDVQAAIPGQNSPAGKVGDRITALVPFSDDFLIFGCVGSVWILRGDPGYQGKIDAVSREVGMLGQRAWCQGSRGEIYFLSAQGLYVMSAGGEPPVPLSPEILPRELLHIEPASVWVQLGWNPREETVHMFLTNRNGTNDNLHWIYDTRGKGFWKDSTVHPHGPTAIHNYQTEIEAYRHLLIGGSDGYIRHFDYSADTDDGRSVPSHVVYQPVRLADDWREGVLTDLVGTMDLNTGGVTYQLLAGDDHQDILSAPVRATGTWTGGLQHSVRSRVRAGSFGLRLSNAEDRRWSVEKVMATLREAGRHRLP